MKNYTLPPPPSSFVTLRHPHLPSPNSILLRDVLLSRFFWLEKMNLNTKLGILVRFLYTFNFKIMSGKPFDIS